MPAAVLPVSMHLKRHSQHPLTLRQVHLSKGVTPRLAPSHAVNHSASRKPSLLVDIPFGQDAKAVTLGDGT